jgi:integrase
MAQTGKPKGRRGFGQITRLPSGRFRARYTGPDTLLHNAPFTFETKMDAEAWLTDERRLVSSGAWSSPKARVQQSLKVAAARRARVFEDYANRWLESLHDLRPTTRESYRTSLDTHLIPAFGMLPIDELTTEVVREWHGSYGNRTPTARAHAYAVLKAILGQAVDDELIARNPCRIKGASRARVSRTAEVLTLSELLALVDAMPAKHRALTLLCGMCGLRFGEAVALRRRDIDLEGGLLQVTRTAVRAGGAKSTNKPKTPESLRTVAMPPVVASAIRSHLRAQPVTGRDGLVFPGADGKLLAPSALYGRKPRVEMRGTKAYAKAGYGFYAAREAIDRPTLHWHDLRRTAATLGAQAGATVREMQSRLGHATPSMALHYQGASAERDRSIADRLQAMVERV